MAAEAVTTRGGKDDTADDTSSEEADYEDFNINPPSDKLRSRVLPSGGSSSFASAPVWQIDEKLYVVVPGQASPARPYTVKSILSDRRYTLEDAGGKELASPVDEDDLVEYTG
ncbi:hypothetical protein QBC35DRAFT_456053 [Podospora australis]|uniref:Uncharacterized protein n=1 Tax=Podospora australis TaxID=1536484 RepID=A0AAN6WKR9_9PEZI|nr:hypothetical protein QBC35DRAFT_456053 [Podospora australis]